VPIVLDLTGKGINIKQLSSSNRFFDMAGDGFQHATAWAGAGNGVLVLDVNHNGIINQRNQVIFTLWDPTAKTDMQALLDVFDTNHDGKLDAGDAHWADFKVMVTNADGTTTLKSLADLGITSINLTTNNQTIVLPDGSSIEGETTYTRTDNTIGTVADASFAFDPNGFVVQPTTTHNADGSTTIDSKAFDRAGNLANETISTTSADGKSFTLTRDLNGDGVIDSKQTDVSALNADGSTTETISNFNGTGAHLFNRTVTTTSADLKTVSISRDSLGNGVFNQTEIDATDTSGNLTVTITDLNPDGTTRDHRVTATSANGFSKTVQTWLTASASLNATETDVIAYDGSNTKTEAVIDYAGSGTAAANKISQTVTTTSADNHSKTITYDHTGGGVTDLTTASSIVINADGSSTITQTDTNHDGSLRGKSVQTISLDGLTRTTQNDLSGHGVFDRTTSGVTVMNADGSRTETVTTRSNNATLLSKSVTTISADGKSRNIAIDANGNGSNDRTEVIVVNADGSITTTTTDLNPNGSTWAKSVSTTSANGLSATVLSDLNGDGINDRQQTSVTVHNADGSSTVTVTDSNGSGSVQIGKTVTTTSADGLTVTTQTFIDSHTVADRAETSVTVLNADGSQTVTVTTNKGSNQVQTGKTVTTTSADRKTVSMQHYLDGNTAPDRTITPVLNADGSMTVTALTYNGAGTVLLDKLVTTTSADGLTTTIQHSSNGASAVTSTDKDVTVLNTDGSKTETITHYAGTGTLAANETSQSVITTSTNGYSSTGQSDLNGDGAFDRQQTSVNAINSDGSTTVTVTDLNGDGTVQIGKTVTTTSATGLTATTNVFLDNHTVADRSETSVTVLNADGSQTVTVSDTVGSSLGLIGNTVTTTSADLKTITVQHYLDNNTSPDSVTTTVINADGSTTETASTYNGAGTVLVNRQVTTTSASGLSTTVQTDINGDGTFDQLQTTVTVLNTDGSRTVTATDFNGSGTVQIGKTVTTTSADGLTTTMQTFIDNHTAADQAETSVTAVNADGSQTATVTDTAGSSQVQTGKTVTTTSADGQTVTEQRYLDGNSSPDGVTTTALNSDGSKTETVSSYNPAGTVLTARKTTTTSADGLTTTVQNWSGSANAVTSTDKDVTVLNADGSKTETVTHYEGTGTSAANETSQTVTTTSPNGFSTTVQADLNGDGAFDGLQTTVTALSADGSATVTVTDFNGAGTAQIGKTVTTTTADGLTTTKSVYIDSHTVADQAETDTTVVNADGSRTQTVKKYAGSNQVLVDQTTTTISADQTTATTTDVLDNAASAAETRTFVTNADGSTTYSYACGGVGNGGSSTTTIATSATGLSKTTTRSYNPGTAGTPANLNLATLSGQVVYAGTSAFSETQTDATVLNTDGSRTETVTDSKTDGSMNDTVATTTSADGLTVTTQYSGTNGSASLAGTTTSVRVLNADGTWTTTVSDNAPNGGSLLGQAIATTSADGLNKTETVKVGSLNDRIVSDVLNADGSHTQTIQLYNITAAGNALVEQDATTTSTDGRTQTLHSDVTLPGAGAFHIVDSTALNADGSKTLTSSDANSDGLMNDAVVSTTSANGLSTTTNIDVNGDGITDRVRKDIVVLNADGSKTETVTDYNGTATVILDQTVTTTSADGLSINSAGDMNGDGIVDQTTTETIVINADGSKTDMTTVNYANGSRAASTTTTTSADGRVDTATWDTNGDGVVDQTRAVAIAPDGSRSSATRYTNGVSWQTGQAASDIVKTVSADGRLTTVQYFNPGTNTVNQTQTTVMAANANGSYAWTQTNSSGTQTNVSGTVTASATHTIDGNGIDTFAWSASGTSGSMAIDSATEAKDLAAVKRMYDTVFDRDMTTAEQQLWGKYAASGTLDLATLSSDLLASTEFSQKYATLTNTGFVEQLYQNTLGRSASLPELTSWLGLLNAGTISRATMAVALSESVEHQAAGNGHLPVVANGSSGLEHTIDKTAATNLVGNIYNAVLGARPAANILSAWVNGLTSGTMSTAQVVSSILALGTAASRLPVANSDFVKTVYFNAFGVSPPSGDLTFSSNALTAGTVSRADVVTAFAETAGNFVVDPVSSTSGTGSGTSYTNYYNGSGLLIAQAGQYASGANAGDTWFETLNANGTLASYKFNDLLGTAGRSYTNSYDSAGILVSQVGTWNSGSLAGVSWFNTFYRDGTLATETLNDVANLNSWSKITGYFDGNGNIRSYVYNNHDGTTSVTVYDGTPANNVLNSGMTVVNPTYSSSGSDSTSSWTVYYTGGVLFDNGGWSGGVANYTIGTYTSGAIAGDTYFETYNSSGNLVSFRFNDLNGQGGSNYINFYNAGVLVSQFGTYDSGTQAGDSWSETFNSNGTARSYTLNDLTGNVGYYYTDSYDGNGSRVSQSGTWDRGGLGGDTWYDTFNANGSIATSTMQDVQNHYAWATSVNYYDTNGNLLSRVDTNHDGTHAITGYANNLILTSLGNDTMTGGGNTETFVFNPSFGRDTITDFIATGATHDVLQFDHTIFASYAQVMAAAIQSGSDVIIAKDANDTVTLKNTSLANLQSADIRIA
jgi:hypothetical protein